MTERQLQYFWFLKKQNWFLDLYVSYINFKLEIFQKEFQENSSHVTHTLIALQARISQMQKIDSGRIFELKTILKKYLNPHERISVKNMYHAAMKFGLVGCKAMN